MTPCPSSKYLSSPNSATIILSTNIPKHEITMVLSTNNPKHEINKILNKNKVAQPMMHGIF